MTVVRRVGLWAGLMAAGCAAEDDGDTGDVMATEGPVTMTMPTDGSTGATSAGTSSSSESGEEVSSGEPDETGSSTGSGPTSETDESGSSESGTTGALEYDPEFIWVADFLRANCVSCHATNANGNLLLPDATITNEEVRVALEGVEATTGLLLVEPGDREMSQTWLQITNEFGAIFPVEDTDRFGAWIDAGAAYYVQ